MNAEIIAVGSELLLGQIVNTNAKYLSTRLAELGINVFHHTVVGDNASRLEEAIKIAESRVDLIIFSGGLGPTKDDLTKETIANHLGTTLVTDEVAIASIEAYFERKNVKMSENNRKQALVLDGATVLPNDHGMAPGMFYQTKSHTYILLPGPPFEMEPMFHEYGLKELKKAIQQVEKIESRVLHFFGIGESLLETKIMDIIDAQSNPTVAPLASNGEVTLRITAKHQSTSVAIQLIDKIEANIMERVGKYFYGYDQTSLMEELVKCLKEKNLTISSAESLTAGMFQSELASISGVSSVFKGGVVCYSNEAKINIVQVKQETIDTFGAVSKECAKELAENISSLLQTDIGISFTGVAGPGMQENKQPGTVWIGVAMKGRPTETYFIDLAQNRRNTNRIRSVKNGINLILQSLK